MDRYVRAAVADMQAGRDDLLAAVADVSPQDWGRYVPYGARTLLELLAHVAAADQAWAVAAREILRADGIEEAGAAAQIPRARRARGVPRKSADPAALIEELVRRRKLLLGLFELLEPRHLALPRPAFGAEHNSARERIWLGYHDRLHAADIRRTLRMNWYSPRLRFSPEVRTAADALAPAQTLYVIFSVDPVRWERASAIPGWTYRQLLAHMRHIIESGAVRPWPDIDAGNAERLRERARSTQTALIDEFLSMRHETFLLMSRLTPAHMRLRISFWWEPAPNDHSILEYLHAFPAHERAHREQLRPAMKYLTGQ